MEQTKLIQLVVAAQKGDETALNELFNAFYNDVYYFALKTLKDSEIACDITQETFATVLVSLKDLKEPAAFVAWMKQIAYSQCTRHFRKKKEVLLDEDEDGHTAFDIVEEDRAEFVPDKALDQQDFRNTIMEMVDALAPEQRAAVLLYYFDELSVKQVAQIQGVSEGTIKSRLNYARKAIKGAVEAYEKKNNVKLHSVGFLPLLLWLRRSGGGDAMPVAYAQAAAVGVSSATGVAISVSAPAAATAVGIGAKLAAIPLVIKIAAGVTGVLLVTGGIMAAVQPWKNDDAAAVFATQSLIVQTAPQASEDQTFPTEETQPQATEPTVTVPPTTEPPATEPPVTEPTVTEPPVTEPPITEPPVTEPPTTEPPITEPPVTEPPVVEPPVEDPPEGEPVPAGCTYVMADGTVLQAGESMPLTITAGDELRTADYTYKYGYVSLSDEDGSTWNYEGFAGWSAVINDRSKSTYASLYSEINGGKVTSLYGTFAYCTALTSVPELPSTVTNMNVAFLNCTALKKAPVLPSKVQTMYLTFADCTSLEEAPRIPGSVTNLCSTFMNCAALESPPEIPVGVELMSGTFSGCSALKTAPVIPNTVRNLSDAFRNCTSLITAPAIPDSVTTISCAFLKCSSMTSIPRIGSGVVDMDSAFLHCSSLTGTIVIDANPENYLYCFALTAEPIVLTGSSALLAQMAQTAQSGNVTVE